MSTFKGYDLNFSKSTPNVERSEGVRPAQHFVVAPYLPLVRFDKKAQDYKVISHGKPVAIDASNYVVPAGLKLDLEYALNSVTFDVDGTATSILAQLKAVEAGTPGTFGNVYTATDVTEGVKNFAGDTVTAGEPVVASMLKSGAKDYNDANPATAVSAVAGVAISSCVGILGLDAWRQNGGGYGDNYNAADAGQYTYANYSMQQGVSILTRYFIEVPVVSSIDDMLWKDLVCFEGAPSLDSLVTINQNSNFVRLSALAASAFEAATGGAPEDAELQAEFNRVVDFANAVAARKVGRILFVDDKWPKDYMDKVRTWAPNTSLGSSHANVAPGSATNGLPAQLSLAGYTSGTGAKTVKINFMVN